jgi:GTPase
MSGFIDEVVVTVESGKGGDGSASFHREKHVPRGGPNGADGGRGGDVVLVADRGVRTLYEVKLKDHLRAGNGTNAQQNKAGRDGEDLVVHVPVGTIVTRVGEETPIADLSADGQRFVVARGGRGGPGNLHFTTSVRQAPTFAQKGEPGEAKEVRLEIKLLADVGLVGLPNAGKSTLISACSAARPKIGAYPFTTITPNLGVVSLDGETFVMADMPGLIEGASEGVGLGHRFLKHVERTRVLVHVVDGFPMDGTDPLENYRTVQNELALYSPELAARPTVVALNKTDLVPDSAVEEAVARFEGTEVFPVSGATSQGLQPLLRRVLDLLREAERAEERVVVRPEPVAQKSEGPRWEVVSQPDGYAVQGEWVERAVAMTDLANREAVRFLHRKLVRSGVIEALREAGAEDGDTVRIGDWEFEFSE